MSVAEFLARQAEVFSDPPECWVIVANSVHGKAENFDIVAAFDTKELAETYVRTSLLPADWDNERRHVQERFRSFRPDSLLWNYNNDVWLHGAAPESDLLIVRRVRSLTIRLDDAPINPTPPAGEMPPEVFAAEAQRRLESSR